MTQKIRQFVVGGAVRDAILGRHPKDIDFVWVGATPDDMKKRNMNRVGVDFPVFLDEHGNEHALARQDRKVNSGYCGFETHYEPSVTIEEDLVRRDLTINSLAVEMNDWEHFQKSGDISCVIDPHNGLQDLRAGVLRHVSEAFAEDPLRVLRTARFAARYSFTIAPETLELMKQLVDAGELDHLTPERVWAELEKAIMEEYPSVFFWTLSACGALPVLFPELGRSLIGSGWALTRAALRNADRLTRLMLLFSHMEWEDINKMLDRLKAPSDIQRVARKLNLVVAVLHQDNFGSWSATAEQVLDLLKQIDAFRRPDDIFVVSGAIGYIGGSGLLNNRMDLVLSAFREAQNVAFATLSDDQQTTLKGADVGRAIDQVRLEKIKSVI